MYLLHLQYSVLYTYLPYVSSHKALGYPTSQSLGSPTPTPCLTHRAPMECMGVWECGEYVPVYNVMSADFLFLPRRVAAQARILCRYVGM